MYSTLNILRETCFVKALMLFSCVGWSWSVFLQPHPTPSKTTKHSCHITTIQSPSRNQTENHARKTIEEEHIHGCFSWFLVKVQESKMSQAFSLSDPAALLGFQRLHQDPSGWHLYPQIKEWSTCDAKRESKLNHNYTNFCLNGRIDIQHNSRCPTTQAHRSWNPFK